MKRIIMMLAAMPAVAVLALSCSNQSSRQTEAAPVEKKVDISTLEKVYDDAADPCVQIDAAIKEAAASGRNVICQVGGNWCRWCLMFADYITKDEEIAKFIDENYVYVHINARHKNPETGKNETYSDAMAKLGNPQRFGFPVMVVLSPEGKVLHFQDSSYLEDGEGYDKDKVMRFFRNWTASAVNGE